VYYQPDVPLNDSRVTVTGLQPYTKYKFCVLWAVAAGRDPLEGAASHLISTLARGPPASAPLELQAAAPDCPGRHPRVGQLAAAAVPGRHARQLQAGERRPFWGSGGGGGGPRPLRPPPPPWIRPCSDELVEGLEETVGASNQMKLLHGGLV